MITKLDAAHEWTYHQTFFYRFAWFTRILLCTAFLPTGMVKLLNERFTMISTDNPIGAFFEAMYQTGLYWQFLGLSQVIAAIFLVVPKLAHLGAAFFIAIMTNIFVVTVALSFKGTPIITGLMLLAVIFLCAYDWPRFRSLFTTQPSRVPSALKHKLDLWEKSGFTAFACGIIATFWSFRFALPVSVLVAIIVGFLGGLLALLRFLFFVPKKLTRHKKHQDTNGTQGQVAQG